MNMEFLLNAGADIDTHGDQLIVLMGTKIEHRFLSLKHIEPLR